MTNLPAGTYYFLYTYKIAHKALEFMSSLPEQVRVIEVKLSDTEPRQRVYERIQSLFGKVDGMIYLHDSQRTTPLWQAIAHNHAHRNGIPLYAYMIGDGVGYLKCYAPPIEVVPAAGSYFISHSYQDADVYKRMIQRLPATVKPYVFPKINTSPSQVVSTLLFEAIQSQDGVIYLDGGYSEQSFWVALERIYAQRSALPIYRFNPDSETFFKDESPPPIFKFYYSHSTHEGPRVGGIMDTMDGYGFEWEYFEWEQVDWVFNRGLEPQVMPRTKDGIEIPIPEPDVYENDTYIVIFWSALMAQQWRRLEATRPLFQVSNWQALPKRINDIFFRSFGKRLLFVSLDDSPLPPALAGYPEDLLVYVGHPKEIKSISQNEQRGFLNRMDDLIVRLHWFILNSQNPEWLYE